MALQSKANIGYGKATATLFAISMMGATALALLVPDADAGAAYQPPQLTNAAVQDATLQVALEYANAVPGLDAKTLRWFFYAIEHRESTFNTNYCNYNDGAGSWNSPVASFWPTTDHLPHGCGLTQLTGWTHEGMAYPGNTGSAPASLNKGIYGWVTPPRAVTSLSTPFDPVQNLRRFASEEVLPDYVVIAKTYPSFTPEQVLRAVAFHWNKGEYQAYQPSNCDYLCLYDQYVSVYKPAVLADSSWPSTTATSTTTTPTPTSTTRSATTFTVNPNVNEWWVAVSVSGSPSSVSATVNGGSPIALSHASWGAWTVSTHVAAGSSVVFTANVNGQLVKSPTFSWLGAAPTPAPSPTPTAGATFTVSPNVNTWWIEVKVSPTATAVSARVNGGAPIALKASSWGAWTASTNVPHGASVVFTATVNGATATSPVSTWP